MTPQETEPKLSASVGGPPVEVWVGRGSTPGRRHCKVPLGLNTLGVHQKPLDPRARSPQAKLPGRECNPTYQETTELKLY